MLNKTNLSHLLSLVCCLIGYFLPSALLFDVGIFALSGSVTNALAVHMLFEKVPFLYGSGVIPTRFQEFKEAIYHLIMGQFFNKENLARFFDDQSPEFVNFDQIIDEIDLSPTFDAFVEVILASSLGGMLNMFGGPKVLESFRQPFLDKLKTEVGSIAHGPQFQAAVLQKMREAMDSERIHESVSTIIRLRLEELTPELVKEIVAQMIREHLGWLVVWGAVFGGLIGGVAWALHKLSTVPLI
jgi:uncharacterized membrane protein YheB (UPF0754 family)